MEKGIVSMAIPFAIYRRLISMLLNDIHTRVNDNGGAANDDAVIVVAIVVIPAPSIDVAPAAVFLGLARRQAAVAPTNATATNPAHRTMVAIVAMIFVAATALPAVVIAVVVAVIIAVAAAAVIVVAEMFAVLSLAFIPAMVGQGTGSSNS
jgi:hypothetical protein